MPHILYLERMVRFIREGLFRHGSFVFSLLALSFLLLGANPTRGQEDEDQERYAYSMKHVKPHASRDLPASVIGALQPRGYRIFRKPDPDKPPYDPDRDDHAAKAKDRDDDDDDENKLVTEIFWAKSLQMENTNIPADVLYGNLKQGSFVGVIHFLLLQRYVRDYRSQMLRPGYYTMRYAVMPKGSNLPSSHNVSEPRDFLLLTPIEDDRSPRDTISVPELVHRSRLASPVHHPVALSLAAIDTDHALPSLITDDEGTATLQLKLASAPVQGKKSENFPLALVVITAIPEDLGD
jgi:hypothetical protein